ncbi:hypothetical protein IAU60_006802 [Kwoniella sp. DSM 27419]
MASGDRSEPSEAPKKPRRSYRACLHCRQRKLKCDLGDPDDPTDGPCKRCRRESRPCSRLLAAGGVEPVYRPVQRSQHVDDRMVTPANASAHLYVPSLAAGSPRHDLGSGSRQSTSDRPRTDTWANLQLDDRRRSDSVRRYTTTASTSRPREGDVDRVLQATTMTHPADALRLLVDASSAVSGDRSAGRIGQEDDVQNGAHPYTGGWAGCRVVKEGVLSPHGAEALLSFFQIEMNPVYPLLPVEVFRSEHLARLWTTESFLLYTILAIAARFSPLLVREARQEVHARCMEQLRQQISLLLEGDPSLQHVSTVEALLLLAEWPPLPRIGSSTGGERRSTMASAMDAGARYDSLSWHYIGLAGRVTQELRLKEACMQLGSPESPSTVEWEKDRLLRTWFYCYNADRHISLRLGRPAMFSILNSHWWDGMRDSRRAGDSTLEGKSTLEGTGYQDGLLAVLLGTIQDRLYSDEDLTATLIRTGQWEPFLRNLLIEIRHTMMMSTGVLEKDHFSITLLKIELNYIVLYGNSIALKALQERRKRRLQQNDPYWVAPALLNLQEGPWIIDAIGSAQQILTHAVDSLHGRDRLKVAPFRVFQRILYAAAFILKAGAIGVIEHSSDTIYALLKRTVLALQECAVDDQHISSHFAVLLNRLLEHSRLSESARAPEGDQAHEPTSDPPEASETVIKQPIAQDSSVLASWGLLDNGTGIGPAQIADDPTVDVNAFGWEPIPVEPGYPDQQESLLDLLLNGSADALRSWSTGVI